MFRVRVEGTYIARSGVMDKEKVKRNYVVEGNIPTTVAALSIVKNKLLGPALAAKYPDYVTFLTYNITKIDPLDEASKEQLDRSEIKFMDRNALIKHIKANNIGACSFSLGKDQPEKSYPQVDPTYYPDLFKLREAVQFAKDDPIGYQKHFAIHEPDLRLDIEMANCNPELFNQKEPVSFDASINISGGAKVKASSESALAVKTEDRVKGLAADMKRDGELAPLDTLDVGDL